MRKFLDIIDLTLIVVVGISVLGLLYFRWYTDATYAFVILFLMVCLYAQNKAMIQLEAELKVNRKALQDALKTYDKDFIVTSTNTIIDNNETH